MSDRELKLRVVFDMMDKITKPMKAIAGESAVLGKAVKATSDRLHDLNSQQRKAGRFYEMHKGLQQTRRDFSAAQKTVDDLARTLAKTEKPTRALTREFSAAKKAAAALSKKSAAQRVKMQFLRTELHAVGIDTAVFRSAQARLKDSIALTNTELVNQQKRLASLGAVHHAYQNRVSRAQQHANKARRTAGHVTNGGVHATVAGGAMSLPLIAGVNEAKQYQTESARITALGLGQKVSADAVAYARSMKTYGTSHNENLELVRDSMSIFGDLPHAKIVAPTLAKMKFGNKAMYGEASGEENEHAFIDLLKVIEQRGGTASPEAFSRQANMVQKVISATGGRVGSSEWLNLLKTGGIAAKIMDDKSFYYQMEPLVQEVGGNRAGTALMSGYSNLYQGRTTKRAVQNLDKLGLIGDRSKVQNDKVGQVSTLGPGALLGSDIFRRSQFEWMEKILLPQLAKNGITDSKQIEDTIGGLFSTRTAGNQFLDFYRQRVQIRKNAKLNTGAYDIEQINTLGQRQVSGKELQAKARAADLKLTTGEKTNPLYDKALDKASNAMEKLNGFMERNPKTAKIMLVTVASLAALLLIIGPLMLGIASMVGPYALLYVAFAKMGVQGGVLTPIIRGLGSALTMAGRAVLWIGRALLMNPIGLAITGIAVAAFLIYKYWEPIKGFFFGLLAQVHAAFSGGISGIAALILNWSPLGLFYRAFAGVLGWFGITLPAKFSTFGMNIMHGLVNGITGALGWVKTTVMDAGASVIGWFKEKLGIHSPSQVFAALGDFTMQGLTVGLRRGESGPLAHVAGMAKRMAVLGAGITISATSLPASAFDTRPPIGARGISAVYDSHDTYQIHITAAPGMDAQAIARAISAELDRRDREKAARRRSSLSDFD
jgi:uncharacterized protein YukE